ncbi:MAG: M48 family metalloprotease [Verrucomicrobia bacterium]|nr:M48 family metalloprotease [Verrucomicrobiota bacterium]
MQVAQIAKESWFDSIWYTAVPHLKDALLQSVIGVFRRVITFPGYCQTAFVPWKALEPYQAKTEITHDSIESGHTFFHSVPKEKLHYIVNRAHRLTKAYGITQQLKIVPAVEATGAIGTSFSDKVVLTINKDTTDRPDEIIDFILAHELAHVAHNHILYDLAFKIAVAVLDTSAAFFVSPLLIPLCEAIAAPLANFGSRIRERDADLTAMKILNTNIGAVAMFSQRVEQAKALRVRSLKEPERQLTLEELAARQRDISPEGDNRLDIFHPSYSQRLAYAQAFLRA